MEQELIDKHGESSRNRIQQGLRQASEYWRDTDGDWAAFEEFVRNNFIADQRNLDETFKRLEFAFEALLGHLHEINVAFRQQSDLNAGPILPVDEILGAFDPYAHINDDFFANKLAFIALMNYPLTTLDQRLKGENWSRRQWAEARLAQIFSRRVPAEVNAEIGKASADASLYISEYNIWMHHLLDQQGRRLFPAKLRLLSHWNLRDELKSNYEDPQGLEKQRMIQKVMETIVSQTIPRVVINNPHVDWSPYANEVQKAAVQDSDSPPPADQEISNEPEKNRRYEKLLNNFLAARKEDPFSPTAPSLIDRKFNEEREIPEKRMREMLIQAVSSPLVPKVAAVIEERLGRKLEPFDIWYSGFKAKQQYTEKELDEIVAKKYPTPKAFEADIPNILQKLGFSKERAEYVASKIVVDPARGSGHAWGAERRGDKSHLRTRVEKTGMNYKGYNIAVHELGHNVEQTFSLYDIDSYFLKGVPNTAFTEALAFVFQARDLELLGLAKPESSGLAIQALNDFWNAYEISGVALVEMEVWRWMYEHPQATPDQLRDATLQISKDIWNRYYAPVFKTKDVVLLGIYSHMIERMLYLPDYPIGRMIAFQIQEKMNQVGAIGPEFERITKLGRISPDLWMKQATGAPVGPDALLRATEEALTSLP
ncbi:hypothetical protein L0156_05330 [bacterium]|nr:hypothetical protein [bacterium]